MVSNIKFGNFDSEKFGLNLLTRVPETMQEQEITETIPGKQGVIDYSMAFGQRIFQPYSIAYTFQKYIYDVSKRAKEETLLKNQIMSFGLSKLYDSNLPNNYYFLAKCSSDSVTNDPQYQKLTVALTFTLNPPFAFCELAEGTDEWDNFDFDFDVSQETSFEFEIGEVACLINNGSVAVQPKITVVGEIIVECNEETFTFSAGTYENTLIYLLPGMNTLSMSGSGSISFEFYKGLVA